MLNCLHNWLSDASQVNFDALEERVIDGQVSDDQPQDEDDPAGGSLATIPAPTLAAEHYKEPLYHSFRVRGPTYKEDGVKVVSAPYMFKLVCCDMFEVPGPTFNICSHPKNRVYRALQRNEDVWIFAMNIMIPGPPYISFVAYYQADKVCWDWGCSSLNVSYCYVSLCMF